MNKNLQEIAKPAALRKNEDYFTTLSMENLHLMLQHFNKKKYVK